MSKNRYIKIGKQKERHLRKDKYRRIKRGLVVERLLTPQEVAKLIAVTPRTIKEWLRRGDLKGVKVGNMWRVRESDLDAFIREGVNENSNP